MPLGDLATEVGISARQLIRYENGQGQPPANVLLRIATVLKTSTDELLGTDSDVSLVYERIIEVMPGVITIDGMLYRRDAPGASSPGVRRAVTSADRSEAAADAERETKAQGRRARKRERQ